jgi:bla regulator protein blaR1
VLAAWMSGAALVMAPWLAGTWVMRRLGRRAEPVIDIYITSMFRGLLGEYSIRRNVRLVTGTQSITPLAWGVFYPTIMLPPEALRWPADRLRAALLHELAHVKRWDCAMQLVMRIVCAIHWFNPLAWIMARRLRAEHERACDDMVLTWGLGEAAYAEHLVVIARSLRAPCVPWRTTVAMAQRSELHDRLVSILDPARRRERCGWRMLLAAWSLTLMFVTPLSMLRGPATGQTYSQIVR